ncbi:FtsK/SpoIIIE domain-containing protein [Demequina lutea]|uniref:S-DNA-T family DNA segregation ATPase FtsK/SpoIIIE n=1 Tax=Demequina lutea TaxID=431489 RepID=A0A7Z0CH91_9MICO|nr:FtsK/SpoIIIE domain-containing protein [Demequina lutea]NYI40604.1 S-DNA-T family DNA segregation ATPase FtsK/SpoIIIE [Demequina lutea]
MSLRLSVTTGEGAVAAVSVTAASDATVGDVAEHLFRADPTREGTTPPVDATLLVTPVSQGADAPTRVAPREAAMAAAGIRSGDHVDVVAAHAVDDAEHSPAVATVAVVGGPDTGKEVLLRAGSHIIGRDTEAAVSLTDPLASPRHARLVVGETFEIVDMGSTNGVLIDGAFVTRATLAQGDRITVGATDMTITRAAAIDRAVPSTPTVPFTRSPRVVPPLPAEEIALPSPPTQPTPRPFPRTALLAPVMLGFAMYLMTGRMLSLVFVAMSPLMMVGGFLDNRHHQRKEAHARAHDFEAALALSERRLDEAHQREREIRLARSPSVADVCGAVRSATPPLWTHRAEHDGFLEVRVGLGAVPSSLVLEAPAPSNAVEGTWERVAHLRDRYSSIGRVPVVVSLRSAGGLGIAGAAPTARAMARAAVIQVAGLHSPMECVIAAFISPAGVREWAWIEWLPHVSSPASPLAGDHVAATRGEAQRLLVGLEEVVAQRAGRDIGAVVPAMRGTDADPSRAAGHQEPPTLPAIVVVVEDDAPADKGRLIRLAEKGPDVNVHVLWMASKVSGLPAACRSFVESAEVATGGMGIAGHVRRGGFDNPVTCEVLSVTDATDVARRLACVEDVGGVIDDAADVPTAVSYLDAHGFESLDPAHHEARWRAEDPESGARRPFSLRALVGHAGDEPCYLDLKTQGPHALVGGTTGAGKSEFLQAWVLGMASAYSPQKVTFLFVDYKGGSAFADCVKLPHCVGLVTDLTPHLVARALASLRAELHYRERLLAAKAAKDLETLVGRGDPDAPPSLVIVIDEFAALAREAPEFVDGVVDIGQRGRSLGLHLIMATQRPAGVIKDSLRANTNLRIALRMADEADSSDILGSAAAAHVDPAIPGRAIARTGPGRLATFQSAYAGAHSTPGGGRARIAVRGLALGSGVRWGPGTSLGSGAQWGGAGQAGPAVIPDGASEETDAARVVSALTEAALGRGAPPPRRPWLDQLADRYDLAALPREAARGGAFGLIDDPSRQAQYAAVYEPDKDGNLMVLGGAGAGKSTALRTLALAALLDPGVGPVHVYGIDAAGGGLDMLRPLPAVADVVDSDDVERVGRMLTRLVAAVRERSRAFTAARASSLPDYRERSGEGAMPRIIVLVDGYGSFQNDYMNELGRQQVFADFRDVLTQGRSVGVNVVLAADRLAALHTSIQALTSRTLVLRLNDDAHYGMLGLRATGLTAQSPPGRGIDLASRKEIQVAVMGGSSRIDEQARAVEVFAASARLSTPRGGPWEAEAIPRMPRVVGSRDVPAEVGGIPVLGIDGTTLTPRGFDLDRPIIITGQAGTGRTSALAWMACAIRRCHAGRALVHVTQRRTSIGALPAWTASFVGPSAGDDLLEAWGAALDAEGEGDSQVVVCIENVQDFGASLSDGAFVQAMKRARRNGHLLIGEADTQGWVSGPLVAELRSARRGLLLAPEAGDAQMLFGVASGRMNRAEVPPGRGIWVEAGKAAAVQVPWVDDGLSPDFEEARHGGPPAG